ncbi:MAG: omptin family outer membrane protease [Treponema sp.]|jgi:outer membrane protease|nr:omptin family outer membrane protease [Treponema sp.]
MKIALSKKLFFIIVLLFCATFLLFSQTNYQLSTGVSAGMLYGSSFELVYRTRDDVVSELRWDMKPLFYLSSFLEYARTDPFSRSGFYARVGLKGGFSGKTGFMEDRDWMAAENALSHFSKHDNITNEALLLDASFGYSFPFFSSFIITPLLNFHYMRYDWTGLNGYAQYGDEIVRDVLYEAWDESIPKSYLSGAVIGYSQNWLIPSFGLSLQCVFFERVLLDGSFLFSPWIWVFSVDDHYARDLRYYDSSSGGYLLEPRFALSFVFNKKMKLILNGSYRYTNDSKGDSRSYDSESDIFLGTSLAGAEYQVWDAGITFSYSF